MISAVIRLWFCDQKIKKQCQKLIDSMPEQITALIKAKGGHTKW